MRKSLLAAFCLVGTTIVAPAMARVPIVVGNSGNSIASELTELADLVKPADTSCADHCWVLDRMKLSGPIDKGSVDFELTGELLHKGSYDIPLFGPAEKVRLENVTQNGARATIGFEEGHYYFHTSEAHFTLRGKLALPEDRTVTIVGPLNALDAEVKGGRVTEGEHLTALAGTALHFDAEGDAPAAQPAIFSVSRALRVGKSIDFEYKVTAQSGTDLGVVHFPLRHGERVVDVAGSTGWRTESEELLLPTTGKRADITITGTLANIASFSPDPRAPFEWWLLESDAEHRVLASGDAKQHDASESPIVRKEPNSRLYLVQRGQHLDVTVQTLESMDVLAATIRDHTRTLVLTSAGDLVMQDVLSYDNNGLDYLYYTPDGKPLYLAIDGASERVMHKDGSEDLMIPMRLGQHTVTVQSLASTTIGTLFGRIAVPGPRVPLATGTEQLTFGLPESVHPVVVTGGEKTTWPLGSSDAIAFGLSGIAAMLALRGWKKRSLGGVTMIGLWFVAKPLFIAALAAGALTIVWPVLARLGKTTKRVTLGLGLLAAVVIGVPLLVVAKSERVMTAGAPAAAAFDGDMTKHSDEQVAAQANLDALVKAEDRKDVPRQQTVMFAAQLAHAGVLDGVRPVALSMPSYTHGAYASRQLVTPSRGFTPVLWYVTDTGVALLALLWLASAAGLAWLSRDRLLALREAVRAALAPKAAPAPMVEQKA
ncbi:MAG TPA: hypothetical protein VH054_18880 [Polyangiaceae bacterium]|jgi:hypothetical protein|nr:hypothetical protein [Polyangiaceae bacterium]